MSPNVVREGTQRREAVVNEDLTREDLLHTADRVIEELLAAAGVTRPPVNAVDVAKHLGMTVREESPSGRHSQPRRAGAGNVLVLSPEASEEGRQWTAAQAVGERLKADLLRRLGFDPAARPGLPGESLPNLLAHHLLTPASWFADDRAAAAGTYTS